MQPSKEHLQMIEVYPDYHVSGLKCFFFVCLSVHNFFHVSSLKAEVVLYVLPTVD